MRNINGIKKNSDFKKVYEHRNSYANKVFVMYVMPSGMKESRIGISVSKKIGNSVVRHRVCRMIRECYRLHKEELVSGLDIVIVARPLAKELGYFGIEEAFLHLGRKQKIFKESK